MKITRSALTPLATTLTLALTSVVTSIMATVMTAATAFAAPPAADTGQRVYTTVCQGCHMADAQGAVGAGYYPKLAGDPALATWQFAAVIVLNGRHGMPSFGTMAGSTGADAQMSASLSDEEIAGVVNYLRTHFGNTYTDKASAKAVSALPHPGGRGHAHAG